MSFFKNLLGKKKINTQKSEVIEQCLILKFDYGFETMTELYELREKLKLIIESKQLGDYDGHEIAVDLSNGYIYMYGLSAQAIFDSIQPVLEATEFIKGGTATLVLGKMGSECKRLKILL